MSGNLPVDRTQLAEVWAEAVANVDELVERLLDARKREAEVWAAIERSRAQRRARQEKLARGLAKSEHAVRNAIARVIEGRGQHDLDCSLAAFLERNGGGHG